MKYFILVIFICPFIVVQGQQVILGLAGRDFFDQALGGPPDPFVKVSYGVGANDFTLVGQTSVVHSKNPQWTEAFPFQYVAALEQHLQFEVIEHDPVGGNDKYGLVNITMGDIFEAQANLERDFGKGILIIKKF